MTKERTVDNLEHMLKKAYIKEKDNYILIGNICLLIYSYNKDIIKGFLSKPESMTDMSHDQATRSNNLEKERLLRLQDIEADLSELGFTKSEADVFGFNLEVKRNNVIFNFELYINNNYLLIFNFDEKENDEVKQLFN